MEIEASSQIYGDREINNIHVFIRCIYEGSMIGTVNMYTRYWMYTKATLEKMEQKVFSVFTRDQYFEFGYNTSEALIVRRLTFH